MRAIYFLALGCSVAVQATTLLDRNLAYLSPFVGYPEFSHDTREIQARHIAYAKRQEVDASGFTDDHYPTFYGGDFSNAPFIWSGGLNFTHSGSYHRVVISRNTTLQGDPFDDSVLLWTRAVPIGTPDQSVPVCVSFKIFDNPQLTGKPLDSSEAFTSYDVDFTVKMEATNLEPDTKYWYQFADCTNSKTVSPIGATRTLSSPDTPADQVNGGKPLTLAVFSCSQFQAGYFNAYGVAAANTSADVFIHLGDYIYESLGNGARIGRQTLGRELATVHDYRQRLGQYRTDVSLIAAHEAGPWITVWSANPLDRSVQMFTDLRKIVLKLGMTMRLQTSPGRLVTVDDKLRIWRNFQIGKLLDLTMLDTRQYDRDITDLYYNTGFYDTLSQSKSRDAIWRVVGQQIVFTQLDEEGAFDVASGSIRNRILDHIQDNKIDNVLILSGDSHANWVSDLVHPNTTSYDPVTGAGSLAVEFAGTAVTSGSSFGTGIAPLAADAISQVLVVDPLNADLQWSEGSYRGFFTLTLDTTTATATYWAMSNISNPNLDAFPSATFVVKTGANKLTRPVAGGKVAAGILKASPSVLPSGVASG
ncbi:hypothetical protein NM688_g4736 [Phlebia brevispora]|uniref:Uncharacterized protein n=1 Tax=Phlebia brevispora TaxID=194682 RepID=A0ACC1T2C8_9APHY|nr:hypothetical protein NM688_g4736 [Phlebia brevispora]